jgi:uroporphyrinogen decarboxylase
MKKTMTSRERMIAAIEFKGPDRLPVKLDAVSWERMQTPEFADHPETFPNDYIQQTPGWYYEGDLLGRHMDNWGCEWLNLRLGNLGQVVGHPLGNIKNLNAYVWPKAADMDISTSIDMSAKRGDKYFMLGYISLFERMINLRGFENLLIDIAAEEEHFFVIRDKILEHNLDLIDRLLDLNPDALFLADDWGSQRSLLIKPDSWRKLFLPVYQKMFARIRNRGKHVFFHSDGYNIEIMPDLIAAGANVFWIEFGVNGVEQVHEKFGGKVAFLALLDTQIIELGTCAEIDEHIRDLVEKFGSYNGGFIGRYDWEETEKGRSVRDSFKKHCGINSK